MNLQILGRVTDQMGYLVINEYGATIAVRSLYYSHDISKNKQTEDLNKCFWLLFCRAEEI